MGLPPKLLARGVKDMVRISDARMSGTAYGTVVLHVCPEAAAGAVDCTGQSGDRGVSAVVCAACDAGFRGGGPGFSGRLPGNRSYARIALKS